MNDTIGMNFYYFTIDERELETWDEFIIRHHGGFHRYFMTMLTLDNGAPVTVKYYPSANNGHPFLYLEFSLPHVVLGANVHMVYDTPQAVEIANAKLRLIPFLARLDLWEGVLVRLDICYNYQVGDLTPDYIRALQHLEYPYRKTTVYHDETVMFWNGSISTKFYDKFKESGDIAAKGVLRQEITIRKAKLIALLGKKHPTLRDITPDFLLGVLEGDLEKLGLLGNYIATSKTALRQLINKYGKYAGRYYHSMLIEKTEYSDEEIMEYSDMQKWKLDREIKTIAETIGPVTVTEREEPLPPLLIDKEMVRRRAGEGGSC